MWYLCQRGLQMLVILAVLSAALFGLLSAMPGNPIDLLITSNPSVKPEDVVRLKKLRGLDKPWYVQYGRWLWGYPEPARPPVFLAMDPLKVPPELQEVNIDLSANLVDPNFVVEPEKLKSWLDDIWPDWGTSGLAYEINKDLEDNDISGFLLHIASRDVTLQGRIVSMIEKESSKALKLEGLLGARAEGLNLLADPKNSSELWFKVTNSYGQEKVGHLSLIRESTISDPPKLLLPIGTRIVEDESKPFSFDLNKFLVDKTKSAMSYRLIAGVGEIDAQGQYQHKFEKSGQSVVVLEASDQSGLKQRLAFDIEHGVIGHEHKFNRGFLFFFAGDQGALGFSQTYKRPVYELLFGSSPICGDGRIDAGETCDDANHRNGDGCDDSCFKDEESFLSKANAAISGYLIRSGRIGNTIQLMLPALVLSLLIAIPLGVFSAYRQYSILDYIVNFLAFVGISLPVFWFGIMMIYLFAEAWQLFPAGGVQTPGIYGKGTMDILADRLNHAILPTLVLSIFYVGRWLRYMRASMLEVLPKDYIRTARAKGLSEWRVILKHAFRNALIPVLTVLAISIPALFGGAVLTETVFSWPGVGRLQYDAVMNSDYYVAIIVFLISASLVMIGNLLADALYVLVDPRIRKQ